MHWGRAAGRSCGLWPEVKTDPRETGGVGPAANSKRRVSQLERALQGRLTVNQRFVLGELLRPLGRIGSCGCRRVTSEIDQYVQDTP